MGAQSTGCLRLFRVAGVTVLLHWSWLLVAAFELYLRADAYPSLGWNLAEYLALFAIVLLHELGHAFACRQVGGTADRVVLWPLGGIAFVNPPARPGALLWSIAAGPLVNVVLVPVTIGLSWLVRQTVPPELLDQASRFCFAVVVMNLTLLVFNLLPVYPLDGGQILHALLWFVLGRARSLLVCGVIGLIGAVGLLGLAILAGSGWLIVLAAFLGFQAVAGVRQAFVLARIQPALDHLERATALMRQGAHAEAIAACDSALSLLPEGSVFRAVAHGARGTLLAGMGDHAAALTDYDEAVRLQPGYAAHHVNRGLSLARLEQYGAAEQDYRQALALDPECAAALNNLAWLWATCPNASFRNGAEAVRHAERACELNGWRVGNHLGTLAAAHAEAGDFAAAVEWQQKALEDPAYGEQFGEKARERVRLYEQGLPYRDG
jgi:Zn-dependent protease/Tfp pilus assembly protein PilF